MNDMRARAHDIEVVTYRQRFYVGLKNIWYERETGRNPPDEVSAALHRSGKEGALGPGVYDVVRKVTEQELLQCAQSNGVGCLYHFTDSRNIESIAAHGGLYSWLGCFKKGIDIPAPGSDGYSRELDQKQGNADFVRLSFVPDPPMLYAAMKDNRINNAIILPVDLNVITWRGTRFSNQNATSGGARLGDGVDLLASFPFPIILRRVQADWDTRKRCSQAEVLVRRWIPSSWIAFDRALRQPHYLG